MEEQDNWNEMEEAVDQEEADDQEDEQEEVEEACGMDEEEMSDEDGNVEEAEEEEEEEETEKIIFPCAIGDHFVLSGYQPDGKKLICFFQADGNELDVNKFLREEKRDVRCTGFTRRTFIEEPNFHTLTLNLVAAPPHKWTLADIKPYMMIGNVGFKYVTNTYVNDQIKIKIDLGKDIPMNIPISKCEVVYKWTELRGARRYVCLVLNNDTARIIKEHLSSMIHIEGWVDENYIFFPFRCLRKLEQKDSRNKESIKAKFKEVSQAAIIPDLYKI